MRFVVALGLLAFAVQTANGDIYMHNPRGSNNRNCRTDNNDNRQNANRLFDSQNNDKGGYSCDRAFPFACYEVIDNAAANNACRAQTAQLNKAGDNISTGKQRSVNTPRMEYFSGSELSLEWTAQHGAGDNAELVSDVIIQYACEDTLSDNCDAVKDANPIGADPNKAKTCIPRDGSPVRTNSGNNNLDAQATDRIPQNNNVANNAALNIPAQESAQFGRHESLQFYTECQNRQRNKGLFTADQNLNGNDARFTRQNPNGNRNGLECPEESEYYPYWAASPWKDVAIITNDVSKCAFFKKESQNVKGRGRCVCGNAANCKGDGQKPNNAQACNQLQGATWVEDKAFGIPAPECVQGAFSRANHLGNVALAGAGQMGFNWTLPEVRTEQRCVLRIRYNMTSTDFGGVAIKGDSSLNGKNSPLKDNDENEAAGYVPVKGFSQAAGSRLSFAMNTDQYARTFQDRSYMFNIKPKTGANGRILQNLANCNRIFNLNVRGKRGNIVQTYPATEYDFVPDHIQAEQGDCVHVQFTGSDYNPNRNGNNGEGGPYAANNRNKETKSDRTNLVQMIGAGDNLANANSQGYNVFGANANYKRLAFLDQPIDNANACKSFAALKADGNLNNRANREETHNNCAKLSGQQTPYFDGGVQPLGTVGAFKLMSTRNNNFSNRGQKVTIEVVGKGKSARSRNGRQLHERFLDTVSDTAESAQSYVRSLFN